MSPEPRRRRGSPERRAPTAAPISPEEVAAILAAAEALAADEVAAAPAAAPAPDAWAQAGRPGSEGPPHRPVPRRG
jgi:hypothetical protein